MFSVFSKRKSIFAISTNRQSNFEKSIHHEPPVTSQSQDQPYEFLSLKQTQRSSQFDQNLTTQNRGDYNITGRYVDPNNRQYNNPTQSSQSPSYSPLTNNDYRYPSQTQNSSKLLQSHQSSQSPSYSPLTSNEYRYSSSSSRMPDNASSKSKYSKIESQLFPSQSQIDQNYSYEDRDRLSYYTQLHHNNVKNGGGGLAWTQYESEGNSNLFSQLERRSQSPPIETNNSIYNNGEPSRTQQGYQRSEFFSQPDEGRRRPQSRQIEDHNSVYNSGEPSRSQQESQRIELVCSQPAEGKSKPQQLQQQQQSSLESNIQSEYSQTSMQIDDYDIHYDELHVENENYEDEQGLRAPEPTVEARCDAIPQRISQYYTNIRKNHCDCAFVVFLAKQLASDIAPRSSFMNLKISLLLSLVSIHENPIHILAVGEEVSLISRIINSIGGLADRLVTGYQNSSPKNPNTDIETSSSIDMAKGGVNIIRELSQMSPKIVSKIMQEISDKRSCAIWSFFNNSENTSKDNTDNFYNIVAAFGLPIVADDPESFHEIMKFILSSVNREIENDNEIPFWEISKFISVVCQISVQFSSEANTTLEKYFEANKIVRSGEKIITQARKFQ